jgi:hypothetical protein
MIDHNTPKNERLQRDLKSDSARWAQKYLDLHIPLPYSNIIQFQYFIRKNIKNVASKQECKNAGHPLARRISGVIALFKVE